MFRKSNSLESQFLQVDLILTIKSLISLFRPLHWSKNILVFAPLVFSGMLFRTEDILRSLMAFISFSLIASSIYVINDILDFEEDKNHPIKRFRPIPSGKISISIAIIVAFLLAIFSFTLSGILGLSFALVIFGYFSLNLLYSTLFKHIVILDIFSVAAGFLLRVLGGGFAIGIIISHWLMICTALLALFLIICKRRHEFTILADEAVNHRAVLQHYSSHFLDQMLAVTTASSLLSYILYTIDQETIQKFGTHKLLLTSPFVAYGIFRYQYLVYRKSRGGDPTDEFLNDRPLLLNIALWLLSVIAVIYL